MISVSDDVRERYKNDAAFAAFVNLMIGALRQGQLTTLNLAEAATLASQLYAERYGAPVMLAIEERDRG